MGLFSGLAGLLSGAGDGAADLIKSARVQSATKEAGVGPGKALIADPYVWALAGGYYVEKPNSASYSVLRYLASRDPLVSAIILTRLRQVRSFASVRTHDETEKSVGRGFRVRLKNGNAKKRTKAVDKQEDTYNNIILHCARDDVPEDDRRERDFGTWLWRFVQDRMTFDQAVSELVLDRRGMLRQFFAVDGATFRLVDPRRATDGTKYVQVYQSRVVAKFTDPEIAFCPENLSTDIYTCGYGRGETELAIRLIMTHIGADESNSRIFSPGSMPKGLLTTENAEIDEGQLRILEAKWKAQVANHRGRHSIPILGIPRGGKLNFMQFPQPTDLEFKSLLDYIVNVLTSLYGMDPTEINFPNRGGVGGDKALFSNMNEEARLTASRDKGLRPCLSWVESSINHEIMPAIDPEGEFEFAFVGWDSKTDKDRVDLATSQVKTFKTVNEVRVDNGLEAREDCDIILDSTWVMAKSQSPQGEESGIPGASQEGSEEADDGGDGESEDVSFEPVEEGDDEGNWTSSSEEGW